MAEVIKRHRISSKNPGVTVNKISKKNIDDYYPAHRHDFYEVLFFTGGSGVHIIDFKEFDIVPGIICLLTPGQVYEMKEVNCEGYVLPITKDLFYQIQKIENISFAPFFYNSDNSHSIVIEEKAMDIFLGIISLMEFEYTKPAFNINLIRNYLSAFLLNCLVYAKGEVDSKFTDRMAILLEEINKNCIQERNVAFYADKLCISSKHLNDLCRDSFGKTVSAIIYERVILEAKREIAFTDKDIREIAYGLEFNDPSYFSRFFKKNVGMTPDEFRKISR